ncbi:hypothetical protein AOQ72_17285 [Bradyrhizobium yuanmingense]|uniref:Uncharacterized protein n=1 Tax=Bradyrhizobium yuanmingense TaxID=108015 RepID=A0A0R3CJ38_9BRAD|nr:hypothetical protein AOQ72_17285 [Bradyrhizobium yuanmingense]
MWNDTWVPRQMSIMRYQPDAKRPLQKQVGGDEIVFVTEAVPSDESGDAAAGNVDYRLEGCLYSQSSLTSISATSWRSRSSPGLYFWRRSKYAAPESSDPHGW